MPTTQDYTGIVSRLKFLTLPTATPDTANDYLVFLDATTGDLARALWPSGGGGGGGGAPTTAEYLVATADGTLSAERVATNTSRISWDFGTSGQAKADIVAGSVSTTYLGGDITTAGKALLDDADAAAQRTTLGLGTAATQASSAFEASGAVSTHAAVTSGVHGISTFGATLVDDANASAARTTLGLATVASTGAASDLTGTLNAAQMPALTGDVTTSAGAVATTLANSGVTAGTYTLATVTVDAKGRVTSASSGSVSGGDVLFSDTPNTTTSIASVTAVELVNKSITFVAGDVVNVEMWGTLLNNSAAARTYTPSMVMTVGVNTLTLTCTDGATVAASGTNRAYWRVRGMFTVASTSVTQGMMESDRAPGAAANSPQSIVATTNRKVWNTTASNMVGSGSIAIRFQSDNATATQQFTVYGYTMRKIAKVV